MQSKTSETVSHCAQNTGLDMCKTNVFQNSVYLSKKHDFPHVFIQFYLSYLDSTYDLLITNLFLLISSYVI
jgi:hypothetical protein